MGACWFVFSLLLNLLAFSFALTYTGQPEATYGWIVYIILAVSSFVVGKFYFKKRVDALYPKFIFIIAVAVAFALASLILYDGKVEMMPYLLKISLVSLFTFIGCYAYGSNRRASRRNKRIKRR